MERSRLKSHVEYAVIFSRKRYHAGLFMPVLLEISKTMCLMKTITSLMFEALELIVCFAIYYFFGAFLCYCGHCFQDVILFIESLCFFLIYFHIWNVANERSFFHIFLKKTSKLKRNWFGDFYSTNRKTITFLSSYTINYEPKIISQKNIENVVDFLPMLPIVHKIGKHGRLKKRTEFRKLGVNVNRNDLLYCLKQISMKSRNVTTPNVTTPFVLLMGSTVYAWN